LFFAWDHGYLQNPKYLFDANMRACIKKSSCLLHCNAGAIALIVLLPTLSLHYLLHCNGAGKGTITLKRLPLISRKSEYSMSGGGFEDWSKLAQSEITHNLESLIKCLTNEMFAHSAAAFQVWDNGYSSVGNNTTMAIASDLRCSRSKHGNSSMNHMRTL
jgi:hypothetical protein